MLEALFGHRYAVHYYKEYEKYEQARESKRGKYNVADGKIQKQIERSSETKETILI